MGKALVVMVAHGFVIAQQFITAQQQLGKIHHAFALALVFIQLVKLGFATAVLVVRF